MKGFEIHSQDDLIIRFSYYHEQAPKTVQAFHQSLPFTQDFIHAMVSGKEFWTDEAPKLDILQENATVFVEPGEVVIGPMEPKRAKTAGCMGIYYGQGKGLDACNVFAKVKPIDQAKLEILGRQILESGRIDLEFKPWD